VRVAEFDGAEIGVLLTGAGRHQAARSIAAATSGALATIDMIVSSGLAGALRVNHGIGQVFAAKAILTDGINEKVFSSADLVRLANESGAGVVDAFLTTDRVITSASEKRALGTLADAVEMESFEVLRRALDIHVPAVAIRAISDAAQEDLPIGTNRIFTVEGEVSIPMVMREVARRPQSIPHLIRFGRQCRAAAETLAQFLDSYVRKLTCAVNPNETETAVVHG